MPREYILRLVFDKNHRTLVALRPAAKKTRLEPEAIGGICFRPFHSQNFAEIVFCAIRADEQVKGYGARLMDHLKEHVKSEGISNFLTYADNHATGYFKKQVFVKKYFFGKSKGFSKVNSSSNAKWSGFIKEYDGGTLMECKISPKIDYLRLREMLRLQRLHLAGEIRKVSSSHVVRAGVSGLSAPPENLLELIPGLAEAGWTKEMSGETKIGAATALYAQMGAVLKAVKGLKDVWPFLKPVDGKQVEDYYKVIARPMGFMCL